MDEIIKLIQKYIQEKSTGKITINFFKGGISSYNVEETYKPRNSVKVIEKKCE